MRNFVQPGESVLVVAPYAVASGAGILVGGGVVNGSFVGGIFGCAEAPAVQGANVVVRRRGVCSLPKAAVTIAQGMALYWDNTAMVVTTNSNSGANKQVGVALTNQAAADAAVQIIIGG